MHNLAGLAVLWVQHRYNKVLESGGRRPKHYLSDFPTDRRYAMPPPTAPALRRLEHLVSEEGATRLREEFLDQAGDDGLNAARYNADEDQIEGHYYNPDPDYGPVGEVPFTLTYADFLRGRLRQAAEATVAEFDRDLVAEGPKKASRVLRLYTSQADRLRGQLEACEDPTLLEAAGDVLDQLREILSQRAQSFEAGSWEPTTPASSGGRPLDDTAPQEEIERLVHEYAARPAFRHRSGPRQGQPKPTTIRDTLLNEHPDVCGELSERALFDRVKRALEGWVAPENTKEL